MDFLRIPGSDSPRRSNAFVVGGILVEPNAHDFGELERLRSASHCADKIFVSHWHFDHVRNLGVMREGLRLEVYGPEGGSADHVVRDGDEVSGWTVISTPGHAEEHVCFLKGGTLIAGDMLSLDGEVAIPIRGGDARKYRVSLVRLLDLDPRVCLPGHGEVIANPTDLIVERLSSS